MVPIRRRPRFCGGTSTLPQSCCLRRHYRQRRNLHVVLRAIVGGRCPLDVHSAAGAGRKIRYIRHPNQVGMRLP